MCALVELRADAQPRAPRHVLVDRRRSTKTATVKRSFIDNGKTTVDRQAQDDPEGRSDRRTCGRCSSSTCPGRARTRPAASSPTPTPTSPRTRSTRSRCSSAAAPTRRRDPLTPNTCWTQYADERFAYGYDSYPAWRSDSAATPRQRAAFVGAPKNQPTECVNTLFQTANQRWVPFVGADRHVYEGGVFGCAGEAPEASPANYTSLSLPTNETFGVTGTDGKGAAAFDIFTDEDHSVARLLGQRAVLARRRTDRGVSCDPEGSLLPAAQRPTGSDIDDATDELRVQGQLPARAAACPPKDRARPAVDGTLWWSPSNWKNRISVPLNFAPSDNVCALDTSARSGGRVRLGAPAQATTQWAPAFCLNPKLFDLTHVQTPEPQARNLLGTGQHRGGVHERAARRPVSESDGQRARRGDRLRDSVRRRQQRTRTRSSISTWTPGCWPSCSPSPTRPSRSCRAPIRRWPTTRSTSPSIRSSRR